jgi:Domain of unknown function (DUF1905)
VPGSVELLGTGRAVKISGTIDGHRFNATVMPSGHGTHWLPIRAALCKLIDKHRAGETVSFHFDERVT